MLEWAWLWAAGLVIIPVLVYRYLPAVAEAEVSALEVPFWQQMQQMEMQGRWLGGNSVLTRLFMFIAWILLIAAAMRPQWVGDVVQFPVSGRDLMMAVDLSGSMKVEDFQRDGRVIDRLAATKWIAGEFILRRQGDRLGLILFGTKPYVQAPLTFDRFTVRTLLDESVIGMAGEQTAIGDAIGLALKRIDAAKDSQSPIRPVLILLTDGANTHGILEPLQAADLAAEFGVKIYTIGIGADEMLVRTLFGTRSVNPSADLDEDSLRRIAQKTGGRYYRARDSEQLQQIYQLIDELEPVVRESVSYRPVEELFYYPLAASLLAAAIAFLLRSREI